MEITNKTNAPLFVAYSANPNNAEQCTYFLDADDMKTYLDNAQLGRGFQNGLIICAVNPIDYRQHQFGGGFGKVKQADLIKYMKMQSDVAQGKCKPAVLKEDTPNVLSVDDFPDCIDIVQVKDILKAKGYDSLGTQGWNDTDNTYYVIDVEGHSSETSGKMQPIKPVNNPVWGQEADYKPMFCTAQIFSLPDCKLTSGVPLD